MIEMLYVLLLEIILMACVGCRSILSDDDHHQLAVELARAAQKISHNICDDLTFPHAIEYIYHAHGVSLSNVIVHDCDKPFVRAIGGMVGKNLQALFKKVRPEINMIFSGHEVQHIFQHIGQAVHQQKMLADRIKLWLAFINKCTEIKHKMRAEQLPEVWFPTQQSSDNEKNFIIKNADIILHKKQKQYLKIDTVITFLPFALMAKHDQESFLRFMQVR